MTITERVMGVGAWSLSLHPDTPRTLLRQLHPRTAGFRSLVVTDVPVPIGDLSDSTILSVARYVGMYRKLDDATISGAGLAAYLGDEDGKGNVIEAPLEGVARSLPFWVSSIVRDLTSGLAVGSVYADGSSASNSFRWQNEREALDKIASQFGCEWRVTTSLRVDVAPPSVLYGTTPRLLVLTDDEGGRDQSLTGVRGDTGRSADVEDYATKVVYLYDKEAGTYVTSTTRWDGYTNPAGVPMVRDALVEATITDGDPSSLAEAELGKLKLREEWTVHAGQTQVQRVAAVGESVFLWAPEDDLCDPANPVDYRGRTVYPVRDRIMGMTWPVGPGHGVYLRHKASTTAEATYLDLSRHYLPESGETTLEIGANPRRA